MIDILIPLVAGILLLVKPDIFMRKSTDEEERKKKRGFFKKIGWALIGVSGLYLLSKALTAAGGQ